MKLRSLRAISIRAALSPAVATAVATDSFDTLGSDGFLPHKLCGAADHSDPLGTLRKNCLRFPLEMNIYLVSCASRYSLQWQETSGRGLHQALAQTF